MIGVENITVEDVKFELGGADAEGMVALFDIRDSHDITVRNSDMASDAEGSLGTPEGHAEAADLAVVRRSEGITFEGNTITNFDQGMAFLDCRDIAVLGNDISGLQGDGIRIGGVAGMLIEGNHLHDFLGSTTAVNHPDMIQIWSTNITVGNADITIRENFLDAGNGANYQMIFGRNGANSPEGALFENLLIEHNVLFGAHSNAISLQDTLNAIVRNNTVLYDPDVYVVEDDGSYSGSTMVGTIEIGGAGAVISDNVAHSVSGGTGNVVLDSSSPLLLDDYRNHFLNVEAGGDGDLRDLMLRPDSALNGVAGSSLTWFTDHADTLTAVVDVTISKTDKSLVLLDASWSRGPDGAVAALGASFLWTFADGSTATGNRIVHDFSGAGRHAYTLTVTLPDGSSDSITRSIEIAPAVVADISFAGGKWSDAGEAGATVTVYGGKITQDGWLEIGGRDRLEITTETGDLFGQASFNLGLTVDRADGANGLLVHFPEVLKLRLDAKGFVHITLDTDAGQFTLDSTTAVFADEAAHRLNVILDGATGSLSLVVDGVTNLRIPAGGVTASQGHAGLTIGNTWGTGISAQVKDIYFGTEAAMPEDAAEADATVVLGSLSFAGGGVVASGLTYTIDKPGAYTDAGIDITKGLLALTRENTFIFEAERFGVAFDMNVSKAGTSGTILYLHQTLDLSLDASGQLVLQLNTDQGWQTIRTAGLDLEDGGLHRISVAYDGDAGVMSIEVDGAQVATGHQSGLTPGVKYWSLGFGHPWKDSEASVTVDNVTISDEPGIQLATATRKLAVTADAPELVLDFEGGAISDTSGLGATVAVLGGGITLGTRADGTGHAEITHGSSIVVAPGAEPLAGQDSFLVTFDLRTDAASGRNVFGIGGALGLDVEGDDFVFHLTTSQGSFTLETSTDVLADRDWHEVAIAYADAQGLLELRVDGQVLGAIEAGGATLVQGDDVLEIGSSLADGFDGGIDDFVYRTGIGSNAFLLG
ncbi:LamG domain-containing protein (plasmid) [Salipiger sp. H15]|uniref:LamG domain-containing protein n=1 Tax=Alloyangia sp. H15 TaxID=3029062 RepID=A0AAU8APK8_9RHOB